jgi:hypothetical protein
VKRCYHSLTRSIIRVVKSAALFGLLLFVFAVPATAQSRTATLTVRLVYGETGKPIVNVRVTLSAVGLKGPPGTPYSQKLAVKETGEDGTVEFELRPPIPRTIFLGYGGYEDPRVWPCDSKLQFSSERALREGIVSWNRSCRSRKNDVEKTFTPKPGEIVLFGRKRSRWD